MKPTRFYSNRQEKKVAKVLGGKQVSNSGATAFQKGDVQLEDWLIECKTNIPTDCVKKQITVKREWLEKNKEEAFAMNKSYSAVAIDFGDGQNYYLVDEKTFKQFIELLGGCNE